MVTLTNISHRNIKVPKLFSQDVKANYLLIKVYATVVLMLTISIDMG